MSDVLDLIWGELQDELSKQKAEAEVALSRSERAETAGGILACAFAVLPYLADGASDGDLRFVTDACKAGEGVGTGTGTPCYFDEGTNTWKRVEDDGAPLSAGGSSGVTSVTATSPLASSGGATPDISVSAWGAAGDIGVETFGASAAAGATGKLPDAGHVHAMPVAREKLTGARTYYVRSDGNDANTGLVNNAGGAFLTLQHAADVAGGLDTGGYDITVSAADSLTYAPFELKAALGSGTIIFVGNEVTPANVLITTNADDCVKGLSKASGGKFAVRGFKFISSFASGSAIGIYAPGVYLTYQNCDFGACTYGHLTLSAPGVKTEMTGACTLSGGGYYHIMATDSGTHAVARTYTFTLTGTPAYTAGFARSYYGGYVEFLSNTFTGSATGKRYEVAMNGSIQTYGTVTLPGNAAGTNDGTGAYG